MATIGIHLKNLSTQQANDVRKKFGAVAQKHHLTDLHGRPSPGDLIIAMTNGTIKTVALGEAETAAALNVLRKAEGDAQDYMTIFALQSLIHQIE